MEILPIELKRNGCTYTQIRREGNKAIYRQEVTPTSTWYEVIRIRIEKGTLVFGTQTEDHERYPCTADWGRYGWTFRTLKNAEAKYAKLPG